MKQEEHIGREAIAHLPFILKNIHARRILLVTGNNSYIYSGVKNKLDKLLAPFEKYRYKDFSANPKLNDVLKGCNFIQEKKFDAIIAVGGGSVLDMGKLINILSFQQTSPIDIIKNKKPIVKKGKPLIAIPTTSGSGSEATHFAVVYVNGIKHSVAHRFLLPDIAIVDPQFTYNLPPTVTATSGMDALSQAVESYWSILSNNESKKYASEAIPLLIRHLPKATNEGAIKSRDLLSLAAHLSGKAINISKTTAAHALSYVLTSHYHISHGEAVGIFLPAFITFNAQISPSDVQDKRGISFVKTALNDLYRIVQVSDANEFRLKVISLLQEINLAIRLSEVGIRTTNDIDLVVKSVNEERLQNNPRKVNKMQIRTIVQSLV